MANTTEQALNKAREALESAQSELRDWHFDHPVHKQIREAIDALAQPSQEPVNWIPIKDAVPPKGKHVWCLREWTPRHLGNDGKVRREVRMAVRTSDAPPTFNEDISCDCWWRDDEGRNWSDCTVHAWAKIAIPNSQPSASVAQAERHVLTDEQIEMLVRTVCNDFEADYTDDDRKFYGEFVRAILSAAPQVEAKEGGSK